MRWIAPSEKDINNSTLEKRLWDAADDFRANSGLKPQEYSGPILGLIFLRFAEARFGKKYEQLLKESSSSRKSSRVEDPTSYHAEGIIYLSPNSRYEYLLTLPESENIGAKVNEAMRDIEKHNPRLAGILPKTFNLFTSSLLKGLLKKVSEIPVSLDFDAFGRVYEYFLSEFAMAEGQGGGEFYTPSSIVKLLTEIIEPYHGRIYDPACGSGGMFVQSARFVTEHQKNPAAELAICGIEKTDETGRLCRLNLAVHGLEGDIRHGGNINSYYDDPHDAVGKFDFVLANPPFNVDAVDKERLRDMVGEGRRFPFGLPRADNANYIWIQMFHSVLNSTGRAGFVMPNSACDARSSEQEIREKLIKTKTVDVMITVGTNMFYTVTLPCTLWFLDQSKKNTDRGDKVLFLDIRNIYRQVDRSHRDWVPEQIGFIANIVRLFRNEKPDFTTGGAGVENKLREVFGKEITYIDVPGLCKVANLVEIEEKGWSLNPGRYVGMAPEEEVSNDDISMKLISLSEEINMLNIKSRKLEELIKENLMDILGEEVSKKWIEYPVKELGLVVTGRTPPTNDSTYFGGDHPFITPGDMRQGKYARLTTRSLSSKGANLLQRIKLPPESICVSCIGWQMGEVIMTDRVSFTNQQINTIIPNEKVNPSFLYYSLRTRKQELLSLGSSAGVRTPILNKSVFSETLIKIPSLDVQNKISAALSAYDVLIEINQKRINCLESIARALYTQEVTNNLQNSKIIPFIQANYWSLISENESNYPGVKKYYATADIEGLDIVGPGVEYSFSERPSRAQKQPCEYSVWFARMKDTYKIAWYGNINSSDANESILSSGFVGFLSNEVEYWPLLFLTITSPEFHAKKNLYATGATQVSLTNEGLERIEMLLPNENVARRLGKITLPLLNQILVLQKANKNLGLSRDNLLDFYMSDSTIH